MDDAGDVVLLHHALEVGEVGDVAVDARERRELLVAQREPQPVVAAPEVIGHDGLAAVEQRAHGPRAEGAECAGHQIAHAPHDANGARSAERRRGGCETMRGNARSRLHPTPARPARVGRRARELQPRRRPAAHDRRAAADRSLRRPRGRRAAAGAPRLLGPVEGDFQLSARVRCTFEGTFDAGALLLWAGERTWAKLAFEVSPQGEPMVVSVITDGRASDDANAFVVEDEAVWLRLSRRGTACALHARLEGDDGWRFVRHFALDAPAARARGLPRRSRRWARARRRASTRSASPRRASRTCARASS